MVIRLENRTIKTQFFAAQFFLLRHVWGMVGWGGMITFVAFAHMLDATPLSFCLHVHTRSMLRHGWGGVGWDDNVNRGRLGVLKVHTGKIDSCWNLAKKFLPSNLLTQSGKNKDLMLWMQCWQWRYEHGSDDLLEATGQKLNNLWTCEG